jgi:hypothetical protein
MCVWVRAGIDEYGYGENHQIPGTICTVTTVTYSTNHRPFLLIIGLTKRTPKISENVSCSLWISGTKDRLCLIPQILNTGPFRRCGPVQIWNGTPAREHREGAEADSKKRRFSDPVLLFWYQDFSEAGTQIQVSLQTPPIGAADRSKKET